MHFCNIKPQEKLKNFVGGVGNTIFAQRGRTYLLPALQSLCNTVSSTLALFISAVPWIACVNDNELSCKHFLFLHLCNCKDIRTQEYIYLENELAEMHCILAQQQKMKNLVCRNVIIYFCLPRVEAKDLHLTLFSHYHLKISTRGNVDV